MQTATPQVGSGALRVLLFSNGKQCAASKPVSITIRHALNRIPWAEIALADGEMPTGSFALSDSDEFIPGKNISIQAGYGDDQSEIFSGIVTRHSVRIDRENNSSLIVECRSPATRMTTSRKNANFLKMTDSAIIKKLISDNGFAPIVDATTHTHDELVQYYCSDWDFMLTRAEACGLLVSIVDGRINVTAPDLSSPPVLNVSWGSELIAFDADIEARTQLRSTQANAWSPKDQAVVSSDTANPEPLNAQGNLSSGELAKVACPDTYVLQTSGNQGQDFLCAWAKACQLKAGLARIRGNMQFSGNARALPGKLIDVQGVGNRFSGCVFVSAVEHTLKGASWLTKAEFGLSPDWHVAREDVMAPANGGLLPGVGGVQIGVVVKIDGDPENEQRIQVKLPVMQAETEGIWARLLQGYASNSFGFFFFPEIGDEVVLAFLDDDPCHPVIIGALYSSAHIPPYPLESSNKTKAIVTRAKHKLEFDEENKIITLTTPGKNKLILDDKNGTIQIEDQHGNTACFAEGGIRLDSPKDIQLSAQGGISLKACSDISLAATQDVKLDGLNVSCEAQVGFVGKGTASAEVSAAGQTTVKGAMVLIN